MMKAVFERGSDELCASEIRVEIPQSDESLPPLRGRVFWPLPFNVAKAPLGVIWSPANPSKKFGAPTCTSPMPAALYDACASAGLPLLRFDYTGVRGSGGQSYYEDLDSTHPVHPPAPGREFADALAFLETRCDAVGVVGMSMGSCSMLEAAKLQPAAWSKMLALASISTTVAISQFLFPTDPVRLPLSRSRYLCVPVAADAFAH